MDRGCNPRTLCGEEIDPQEDAMVQTSESAARPGRMLEGKAALITGGARGIGRATALLFAREGARVAVADMSADGTAETVSLINQGGGQAISIACDVTSREQVEKMVAATVAAFGRLDCAFNNAGIADRNSVVLGTDLADQLDPRG